MRSTTLRVLYVVAYRDPAYVRTRVLTASLDRPGIKLSAAKNRSGGVRRYAETLGDLRRQLQISRPDAVLLGFRGYEIFPIVRRLTRDIPLLFDAFLSPSDALVREQKMGIIGAVAGRLLGPVERSILAASDAVLTDTDALGDRFATRFDLDRGRFHTVYVGADPATKVRPPRSCADDRPLQVLFYGSFLPLHGVDVILAAARELRHEPIRFQMIGGGARGAESVAAASGPNVVHERWVDYEDLRDVRIPASDVVLGGPFGGTPQASIVVTGKTYQGLASGVPTVVGMAADELGFQDRVNCLHVPQNNAAALAASLRWALKNRNALDSIGRAGRRLYDARFSVDATALQLEMAIDYALGTVSPGTDRPR